MWGKEERLGEALDRRQIEALLEQAYTLVVAKLPKSRQPAVAEVLKKRAR